jgi:hypothetical protein
MSKGVKQIRNNAKCLACQRPLGVLDRLAKRQFCCAEHEEQYQTKLKDIAVTRLQTAKLRLDTTRFRRVSR